MALEKPKKFICYLQNLQQREATLYCIVFHFIHFMSPWFGSGEWFPQLIYFSISSTFTWLKLQNEVKDIYENLSPSPVSYPPNSHTSNHLLDY